MTIPITTTEDYKPISPAPRPLATDKPEEKVKTGLIGDDENLSKEQLLKQAEDARLKLEEDNRKAVEEAINNNMEKHRNAMNDTMYEVMNGKPREKKESDK